ncbi:MAG: hypothetical protein R3200_06775 [Xanthomonadales bacterium]|nr:hypothetical protein [Xanthomonadales bacterium]
MHDTRDPLKLRGLPQLDPPGDAWAALEARMQPKPRRAWPWAAAAVLVLVLAGGLFLDRDMPLPDRPEDPELAAWITYSQVLEEQLRSVRGRTAAYRGHQAVAMAELEDMVAAIDASLARAESDELRLMLWQQRALLLDDLVAVHAMGHLANDGSDQPTPIVTRIPVTLASNSL